MALIQSPCKDVGTSNSVKGDSKDLGRRWRAFYLILLALGVAGGLGTYIAGVVAGEFSRLSMPGAFLTLSTILLVPGMISLRIRQIPLVLNRQKKIYGIRSFEEEPVRGWGMTIFLLFLGLFFFILSIGLFAGWIRVESQQ